MDSSNRNPSRKGEKTIDLYCYIKVLKVKPVYQQMTLSPKQGVAEISTLWHFGLPFLYTPFLDTSEISRLQLASEAGHTPLKIGFLLIWPIYFSYIKYSEVCARTVRNCLKPELRADAVKSRGEPSIIKATKWEGGKPVGKRKKFF